MPKKKSLKTALSNQQSRLKKQELLVQAAKLAEKKKGLKVTTPRTKPIRPTIPFKPTDKILLIGEGNFSFAYSLVVHPPSPDLQHLPAQNITATAYDTEEECLQKYTDAGEKIQVLREKGVQVLFGIDATKLEKCAPLKGRRWNKVVWNFPHAGLGIADQDRNILSNQVMMLGFFRSVAGLLVEGRVPSIASAKRKRPRSEEDEKDDTDGEEANSEDITPSRGTVIISLRNVPPYTTWDVPKLAKRPPPPSVTGLKHPNPHYVLLRSFVFCRWAWKDYEHRSTKGERGKTGEGGEDRSWEFYLKDLVW